MSADLVGVQIALLLTVAVVLMCPWRLVTWRRCELCRSITPKRSARCRCCGASAAHHQDVAPAEGAAAEPSPARAAVEPAPVEP